MTGVLEPVRFDPPLVNPSPGGLWSAVQWQVDADGQPRWLADGVEVRVFNFGGEDGFGIWAADWCAQESDLDPEDVMRSGGRPEPLAPFPKLTVWSSDECDMTERSREEIRTRAAQNLRMLEQTALEEHVGARMITDAGAPTAVDDVVEAVGALEDALAGTNTVGFIHARPGLAAQAARANLLIRNGTGLFSTPLGHRWVFGGGYVDVLGSVLVATSQPFGWRTETVLQDSQTADYHRWKAVSSRSFVVGYEAAIASAEISP